MQPSLKLVIVARDGNDIVDKIGGTHRWRGRTNLIWKCRSMNAQARPAIEVSDDTKSAASGGRNIHVLTPDCRNNGYMLSMAKEYSMKVSIGIYSRLSVLALMQRVVRMRLGIITAFQKMSS
jgi:hypothetical protein